MCMGICTLNLYECNICLNPSKKHGKPLSEPITCIEGTEKHIINSNKNEILDSLSHSVIHEICYTTFHLTNKNMHH